MSPARGSAEIAAARDVGPRLVLSLLLAGFLIGCEETDECRKLKLIERGAARALASAKGRAALAERTGRSLERMKKATEAKLEEHGLDLSEEEILAALEARAEAGEGVELERTVRPAAPDPRAGPTVKPETETVFRFTYSASDLEKAWDLAEGLMASPPLTRLLSFVPPKSKGEAWRLELGRVDVQRLPMDIEPRQLPPRPKAEDVPSELGFCGASELRSKIAALEAKIAEVEKEAEATTVNLPLSATWRGLSRRADLAIETEVEARRLAERLVDAAVKSRQRVVALGVEAEAVLLEVKGDEGNLARIQAQLEPEVLSRLREIPGGRKGVARMALGNQAAAAGRRPEAGGMEARPEPRLPGSDGHGRDEHDLE